MQIKAKRIDRLEDKVKEFKNEIVIKYLNSRGYNCNSSTSNMRRVNGIIKKEKKRVMIQVKDERLLRIGSYYVWDGYLIVKLVDNIRLFRSIGNSFYSFYFNRNDIFNHKTNKKEIMKGVILYDRCTKKIL